MDLPRALEVSREAVELFRVADAHPGVPAFSGGLMDAWPSWAVDALAVCREEAAVIRLLHLEERAAKEAKRG